MLRFILLVNKLGQPRLKRYYDTFKRTELMKEEINIVKMCLLRPSDQCTFFEHVGIKVVFRRYRSLVFIVGVDQDENELGILEFIQLIVETLDQYFPKLSELDIMFNVDRVHMLLDEMVSNGNIVESNKSRILKPLIVMDQAMER